MLLVTEKSECHISHYFHLVSAYELCPDMVNSLMEDIREAIVEAKKTSKPVEVSQDATDHVFLAFPSGRIGLYACMGIFDIKE